MVDNSLPRDERLRSHRVVDTLFSDGKGGFIYPFRYQYRFADSAQPIDDGQHKAWSVLFSVPKKYHKRAVKRNLLRRRTKEAYRLNKSLANIELGHCDLALIYSTKEVLPYEKIRRAVEQILRQVNEKH